MNKERIDETLNDSLPARFTMNITTNTEERINRIILNTLKFLSSKY